ncbi:hypothetical protein [Burkholderia vietnamiensis]|uniref:hypothetical protein n=1 Tax=Burkholderia vietnamiensis TaxID=60552 RepID=UPI003F518D63
MEAHGRVRVIRLVRGMLARGMIASSSSLAQIKGVDYGFPESRAARFVLLINSSAWLCRHELDLFLVALLDSQPTRSYTPSQLLQDVRRRGVEVPPVHVPIRTWVSAIEGPPPSAPVRSASRMRSMYWYSVQTAKATFFRRER